MKNGNQNVAAVFANRKAKEATKDKKRVVTEIDLAPYVKRFGQEKLDEWKKECSGRELIHLKADEYLAVLRPPTAEDLGEYMMAAGTNGLSKATAAIIEDLWLDGDTQLIDNEDYFIAVFLQFNKMMESKKADFFRF